MSDMVELHTIRSIAERKMVSPRAVAALCAAGVAVECIEMMTAAEIHDACRGGDVRAPKRPLIAHPWN